MNKLRLIRFGMHMRLLWAAALVLPPAQAQPTITVQLTNQTASVSNNASFTIGVLGEGPFSDQWQFNGSNLPASINTTVAGDATSAVQGSTHGRSAIKRLKEPDLRKGCQGNQF
jgi:hypothetical protein